MVEIERTVLPPLPNSPLGSPRVRPTGTLNLNPRQVQVIKGAEEERAGQAQLANLASRYNNRFNPELRAAITAQQELGRNSTAAADYVTQIGMERRKEEIQRGLLGVDQPNGLAGKAADVGADLARDQNTIGSLSGLLGDLDYKGILNQLVKTFQRPEMLTPGVNALTSFGMSGAALNQAEMAGAAAEQERMDKLAGAEQVRADKFAIAQINNAPGAPKLTGDAVKLYDRVNASRANASLVQKMKIALTEGTPTGAIGTGEQALIAMLNALNIPIGTASSTDYDKLVAELKAGMLRSGRLLKADFQLLEKQLPNSGTFKNKEQLLNSLRSIEEKSNRQLYEDQQLLSTFGLPAGSGAMPSTMIRSRNN